MSDESNNNSRSRFRTLIAGGEEKKNAPETDASPLSRLPRMTPQAEKPQTPKAETDTAQTTRVPPPSAPQPAGRASGFKFGPAFWTVTGLLSLIVNAVLIAILIIMFRLLGVVQATSGDVSANLLGGLYSNFEKMDRASIVTNIPVDAQVPLDITVPVQKTTEITLAQDVVISGARVRINTSGIDIDAPANVTLPAGTKMTVNMNFNLQVQDTIPVHLDVPVKIPLAETELHVPFTGLQDVIRPLYCLVEPGALDLDNAPICR